MKTSPSYRNTWIALSLLLLASSMGLVLMYAEWNAPIFHGIRFLSWALTIASGMYLFMRASRSTLSEARQKANEQKAEPAPKEKKGASQKDSNTLDVQAVAQKIGRRLKVTDSPNIWGETLLKMLVSELEIMSGMLFTPDEKGTFISAASYAVPHSTLPQTFQVGEGLNGQAVQNKQLALYRDLPDSYASLLSGLGKSKAGYLAIVPILSNGEVVGCLEVAGFKWKSERLEQLFNLIASEIGSKLSGKGDAGKGDAKKDTTDG